MSEEKDFLKDFSERFSSGMKEFTRSVPLDSSGVCRKETLGKDFECNCTKCSQKEKQQ